MPASPAVIQMLNITADHISRGECPSCGVSDPRSTIREHDAVSTREHEISGMCQDCQDEIFN